MSTIDQAFVQAFARRKQPAAPTPPAPRETSKSGEIQVDASVADSTQVWIDPVEDRMLRSDPVTTDSIPQPHVARLDTPTPISPSHHVHTAYVYAAPDTAVPVETTPDVTPDPSPAVESAPEVNETVIQHRFDDPNPTIPSPATERRPATSPPATPPQLPSNAEPDTNASIETEIEAQATPAPESSTLVDSTPLSNAGKSAAPIHPIWEVDAFDVPKSVADLFFEEKLFQIVAERLRDAVRHGLRSIVVTSAHAGEGRSTVAIGMAMAASATGLHVALVDGDTQDPTLVDDLRLDVDFGWLDSLRGGVTLDQIAVYSVEDSLTFIPLLPPQTESLSATGAEVEEVLQRLDDQFDLVIIDAPSGQTSLIERYASLVDSAIIARDASRTDASTINQLTKRLRESGLEGIGIVDNFA